MSGLTVRRETDEPVAYRDGVRLCSSGFLRDITRLRTELEKRPERTWGLFVEDGYGFAASLVALLLSEKRAVILPHVQTGFLENVEDHLDGLVTDRSENLTGLPQLAYAEVVDTAVRGYERTYEVPDGEVALFTSGSTGEPKLIPKRLSQLVDETRVLERLWGEAVGDSVIVSTVTHQHIYGLLFRIVWPLASNRPFSATTCKDPDTLADLTVQLRRITLVSSPAYLKRMAESLDLGTIAPGVAMVFSSGGPLPNHAAMRIYEQLGRGVREIYGSTETGGIAYRSQTRAVSDVPWTALPSVEIGTDPRSRCLTVASPFEGSGGWHTTADTAMILDDGSFQLEGRADSIVKVEEKRLSLVEMEQRLTAIDLVVEAGAAVQQTSRASVVVAVVLSEQGNHFLGEHGKWQLQKHLRLQLLRYFEPVLLPRKWRFVTRLPLDPQGKLSRDALLALFEDKPVTLPEVEQATLSRGAAILNLSVPGDLMYFRGHFPGQPVLPGVVQVDWAIAFAREYLGVPAGFRRMDAVKFNRFITPDDRVTLTLTYEPGRETLRFTYTSGSRSLSSGRIVLGDDK